MRFLTGLAAAGMLALPTVASGACPPRSGCTTYVWDPETRKCFPEPTPGPCNDGNPCTYNDQCDVVGNGLACTGTPIVCPDQGCESRTCNGTSTCTITPAAPGKVCRAALSSVCDVAEVCTGTSTVCPADVVGPPGVLCRATAGPCDTPEYCTGLSGACPQDVFLANVTLCRPAAGVCDAVDYCSGSSAACPQDLGLPVGTACGSAATPCASSCDGNGTCLDAVAAHRGTSCGAPNTCAQVCDGVSGSCQPLE